MLIELLSSEKFIAFGDVIELRDKPVLINKGFTQKYADLAKIDTTAEGGQVSVNIFRTNPQSLPFKIQLLERHPLSSQAFYPLSDQPYLVVVAPAGELDESKIRIFLARNQGVNYHAGTWHHFSLALNTVSDFLVIDRKGSGPNCDEVFLQQPIEIQATELPG